MRRHKTAWLLGVLLIACASPAFAQRYIDLGPPFVELQSLQAPALGERTGEAARAALVAQFAAGRYEEAVGTAQDLLAQAREQFGDSDTAIVPTLQDLAVCQHHAEDYRGAVRSYEQALELLASGPNSRDPRLAQPLYGLGVAQFAARDYAGAVDNLQRAVFVTRVNDGLNSLNQLRYYDALTEAHLALGSYNEAVARQKARIAVVQQATDVDSAETTAAIEQAARLYRRIDHFFEERDMRRREVSRIAKSRGYDDISLVPKLRELAATYRLGYAPDYIAVGDLERALDILDKHPEADTLDERVAVLVELGDLFLTFNESPRALRYYKQAYKLLDKAGNQARIQALFSEPVPVFVPRPDAVAGVGEQPAAGLPQGYVLLEYDLGSTGKPRDVKTLELEPASASIMRPRAERALRAARIRPVIGPEGPQNGKDLLYQLNFNYVAGES